MANGFITPKAIKERAEKIWQRGDFHKAYLENNTLFPFSLSLPNLSAKELLSEFSQLQNALDLVRQDSLKNGYLIENKSVNHRQLGEQKIPSAIVFNDENIFLRYLGKTQEFTQFKKLATQTLVRYSNLHDWLIRYPFKIISFANDWESLLTVCDYFIQHPIPDCYVRQLDISGIDTKFIERHKAILTELLDCVLPEAARDLKVTGLINHGFERRYGLRYELPQVRIRILDKNLAIAGLTDLTLTVNEFRQWDFPIKTVFVTENKTSFLAFPEAVNAMVIFGGGYAIDLLANARCLQKAMIYYWGDLDTHGFAILSKMRKLFPQTQSLLMNEETLQIFKSSWGEELQTVAYEPDNLTYYEQQVFVFLKQHKIRLEQEFLSYSYLLSVLNDITEKAR